MVEDQRPNLVNKAWPGRLAHSWSDDKPGGRLTGACAKVCQEKTKPMEQSL